MVIVSYIIVIFHDDVVNKIQDCLCSTKKYWVFSTLTIQLQQIARFHF